MAEVIQIRELGDNVTYHSISSNSGEVGHVMVGIDHLNDTIGRLIDLEVKPLVRRRGLGGMLVINAIRHLSQQGVSQVEVDVLSTNTPALNLYDRLGFSETGREKDGKEIYIKMRRSTNM